MAELVRMGNDVAAEQRWIIVKAKGGLGNRILSAVCGLLYAELSGRTATIDWRDGLYAPRGVNAYPLLFETPLALSPDAIEHIEDVVPSIWAGRLDATVGELMNSASALLHRNPLSYRRYCVPLEQPDRPEALAVYWSYVPKFSRIARALRRDPRFAGISVDAMVSDTLERYFTPNTRIRCAVDALLGGVTRPLIGVHVRYSDLRVPLAKIWRSVDSELAKLPGATVFLATDNSSVQEEAWARYGSVATIDKWLPEDGRQLHGSDGPHDLTREAENALIDMHVLALCDRLIYSSQSTFSTASRLIGRMAPEQAIDVDRFSPVVRLKALIRDQA